MLPKQDSLMPEYVDPYLIETPTKREQDTKGSKITLSQIGNIASIYNKKISSEKQLKEYLYEKEYDRSEILENAKWSIYGTQMHSLQYFTTLFSRSAYYDRFPNEDDFRNTFIQRKPDYYNALLKIKNISKPLLSKDILDSSQNFWNEWRMNGQDFTPEKHKNYILTPSQIQNLWEGESIKREDIEVFRNNYKNIDKEKINPEETLLLNETMMILNLYFNNSNLLIPIIVDEIVIPKDFPNTPIKVIDYKTGKQFKIPGLQEKTEIYITLSCVLTNIINKAKETQFRPAQDDTNQQDSEVSFPFFIGKHAKKKLVSSIYSHDIYQLFDLYKDCIEFEYINPLTQNKLVIKLEDIGLNNRKGIENINGYLENISNFYLKNKNTLKYCIDSRRLPYTLPTFPIKNFTKNNACSRGIQLPIF